jgi:(1->4)-alpha-D-glucan 1-alpha-D-glucosylmutase
VVPRLVLGRRAGWEGTWVDLPAGGWRDVLTGEEWEGGRRGLGELLARFPVALLERR